MRSIVLLASLLAAAAAWAAGSDQALPESPYDTNPRCAERTTDGNAPECIVYDAGVPRHTYPPRAQPPTPPTPTAPTPAPAPSSSEPLSRKLPAHPGASR